MQCPMCYDLYNCEQKIPRNLHCGHTICEQCLCIAYEKKKCLDCPTCRHKHDSSIKPNSLTKNFIALQLACQKKEIRQNHEFCKTHDQPYKFYCETDEQYICIQCITEHTGHKFVKQDQNFFSTKKNLTSQIQNLQQQCEKIQKVQMQYNYIKKQLLQNYEVCALEMDNMYNTIKLQLSNQHHYRREQLRYFLQHQIKNLQAQQSQICEDLQQIQNEKKKAILYLQKIQKQKKIEDKNNYSINFLNKKYTKPLMIEYPALLLSYSISSHKFISLCYKENPKICFFGERKKLLTLCLNTSIYSLTTINNSQIQYYASACTLPSGEIFLTGGGSSSNCYQFNCEELNQLVKKKCMTSARKQHSCVYLAGKIYAISGYDSKNKGMAGCEVYDCFLDQWKIIKGLHTPRCAFASITCSNKIYVFGGYDGKDRLSSIEVYCAQTNKWTQLSTRLFFPLSNAAAVNEGDYIYILGGGWSEGFNQQVFQFNTITHEIINYQKMIQGRDLRNKAIKYKNQIYAIGGNFYDGEKLDLRQNIWYDIKSYNDLVNDNLDSWCCALSYTSLNQDSVHKFVNKKKLQTSCQNYLAQQ